MQHAYVHGAPYLSDDRAGTRQRLPGECRQQSKHAPAPQEVLLQRQGPKALKDGSRWREAWKPVCN